MGLFQMSSAKTRSLEEGGPQSNMTGVFVKGGNTVKIDTQGERYAITRQRFE